MAHHISRRGKARFYTVQALYQWEMAGETIEQVIQQFLEDQEDPRGFDQDYFQQLLRGVATHVDQLDTWVAPYLDRGLTTVDPVTRAILRLGAYELGYEFSVPYRVVLNEAIELAKQFGAPGGHRYVNGVLDKLRCQLRQEDLAKS